MPDDFAKNRKRNALADTLAKQSESSRNYDVNAKNRKSGLIFGMVNRDRKKNKLPPSQYAFSKLQSQIDPKTKIQEGE